MKQADRTIIEKMIGYCDQISAMMERFGRDLESFRQDKAYQYAVSMCILQIGELINRLSPEVMETNVQVPWRLIRAMRNVFAHDYDRTKPLTVWQTITEDIPALRAQLLSMLDEESDTRQ
ncbi:MAG: DUF86 domain-containing protein [Clostridiales bacterium]|nr:DUF86 domain-containing protein [Clostridiales bacterium]